MYNIVQDKCEMKIEEKTNKKTLNMQCCIYVYMLLPEIISDNLPRSQIKFPVKNHVLVVYKVFRINCNGEIGCSQVEQNHHCPNTVKQGRNS